MPTVIVTVAGKGAPLTSGEFDTNLINLRDAADAAQADFDSIDGTMVLAWLSPVDGSGSGLDADMLDAYHASATPTASTIPVADGTGKLATGWLPTGSGGGLDADTVDTFHASQTPMFNEVVVTGAGGLVKLPSRLECGTNYAGAALRLNPGDTSDHCYMEFYARSATPGTRSGYFGYDSAGNVNITLINQLAGDIILNAGGKVYTFDYDGKFYPNAQIVMPNNQALEWKNNVGTVLRHVVRTSSNEVYLGGIDEFASSSLGCFKIPNASISPQYLFGAGTYTVYHSGNLPDDTGFVMSKHYYTKMFDTNNVFVHYYPSGGNSTNHSVANLRVWDGSVQNVREFLLHGDGRLILPARAGTGAGGYLYLNAGTGGYDDLKFYNYQNGFIYEIGTKKFNHHYTGNNLYFQNEVSSGGFVFSSNGKEWAMGYDGAFWMPTGGTFFMYSYTGEVNLKDYTTNLGLFWNQNSGGTIGMYNWGDSVGIFNYDRTNKVWNHAAITSFNNTTRRYGGNWEVTDDNYGLLLNGGAMFYKKSGTGPVIKTHSDAHMPKVETTGSATYYIRPVGRGAMVYHDGTVNTSLTSGATPTLNWNVEGYDTDTVHDNVTNNQRLTVPSNITKVKLRAQVRWSANGTGYRIGWIIKNGAQLTPRAMNAQNNATASTGTVLYIETPILTVTAGDYFEVQVSQNSGSSLSSVASESWFEMEILG